MNKQSLLVIKRRKGGPRTPIKKRQKSKLYRQRNKSKIKQQRKRYYRKNKYKIKLRRKIYRRLSGK